jgi:hypothetical protein
MIAGVFCQRATVVRRSADSRLRPNNWTDRDDRSNRDDPNRVGKRRDEDLTPDTSGSAGAPWQQLMSVAQARNDLAYPNLGNMVMLGFFYDNEESGLG